MKNQKNSRRILRFAFLSAISLFFIVSSIWFLITINEQRIKLTNLASEIDVVSEYNFDLISCFQLSDDIQQSSFINAFDRLTTTEFDVENSPELTSLYEGTEELKSFFKNSNAPFDHVKFETSLLDLQKIATELIAEKRSLIDELTEQIESNWQYIYVLLLTASGLGLILIFSGFLSFFYSKKANTVHQLNTLYLQSMKDCVITSDNHGNITQFNKVATELFGYTETEALGMNVVHLYAEPEEFKKVEAGITANENFTGEITNKRKNGEEFIATLSANKVYDAEGNLVGIIGISRDITNEIRKDEQFQHIVNNATDIIYTTNFNGEITYVNPSAKDVLGYSPEEAIGMNFKEIIHPDSIEDVANYYNQQFKNREAESYLEFKLVKKDGDAIWVGQNVKATFNPSNTSEIVGFFGIIRNLNDIKKVQFKLAESESKYRDLIDNSKDLIQSIDASGNLLYVNEAWSKTLGYSIDDSLKMNLFEVIHPDSIEYCNELLQEILKEGLYDGAEDHVMKMLTANKETIVLKGSISVTYENGQVKSLQTFFRDVTNQSKIEKALKQSEENFRLISSSINDVFFLYDIVEERYDYISPNCENVLGASASFFVSGNQFKENYIHQDDRGLMDELDAKVRNGESGEIEYRRRVSDGEIKWVNEKWFPILNEKGEAVSISGVCRDVTEVKEAFDIIYNQNNEINQSIHYAQNIQESTLPTPDEIRRVLPDSFVFYKPKDVLSGDFFIVENVRTQSGSLLPAFVVGDCTGHGVPGGLLSLLCSSLLKETLSSNDVNSPAEALTFVREKLIRLFRSNPSKYILDGMDAAFCVINKETKELYFAGANLSCFVIREDEVLEYRGDKQHIGYSEKMMPFVHFAIDLEDGDQIYLTTDGFIDQFGGARNKKFLRKRFLQLLLENKDLPMSEQQIKVEERFTEWKGDANQTDDIAVLGVRYNEADYTC